MRKLIPFFLLVCFLTIFSTSFAQDKEKSKLYLVQKIYIGSMGSSDEAERFRLLLDDALSKKGFVAVDKEEKADAILTGAVSVRVHDNGTAARVTALLKLPNGERLWSDNLGARLTLSRKDRVQLPAEDLANALRDEWKKSAKIEELPVLAENLEVDMNTANQQYRERLQRQGVHEEQAGHEGQERERTDDNAAISAALGKLKQR